MSRKPFAPNPFPYGNKPAGTARTEVRNSPIPRASASASAASKSSSTKPQVTREMIARRAYEIWQSGSGGSDMDNWLRAERELRA